MFTENSAVVKIWVKQIKEGKRTVDEIPNLENLKDVVMEIIESGE